MPTFPDAARSVLLLCVIYGCVEKPAPSSTRPPDGSPSASASGSTAPSADGAVDAVTASPAGPTDASAVGDAASSTDGAAIDGSAGGTSAASTGVVAAVPRIPRATIVAKTERFARARFGEALPPGRIRYPSVRIAKDPSVERAINDALGVPGFPKNLLEKYEDWLDELDFEVNTNDDGLLDLTITLSGTGAYPSTSTEHWVFDLDSGRRLTEKDLFEHREELAKRLDRKLQRVLDDARGGKVRGLPDDCPKELYQGTFTSAELGSFTVRKRGVTFDFPFEFPHAVLACQPSASFELPWSDLAPFLSKRGPLIRKLPRGAPGPADAGP